ncbi:MAG: hypothetical protein ACRDS0_37940 [Pseudonocardiaceae bacterium]
MTTAASNTEPAPLRDRSSDPRPWRDRNRLAAGAGWGATATAVMAVVMLAGTLTGVSPMPMPIPVALVAHTLGALPMPGLLALGLIAHLAYGAAGGLALAALTRRVNVGVGLAYGGLLWLLMGLVWLPFLGWGLFGTSITPAIAAATLLLHLIYGGVLGILLGRRHYEPARTAG